MAAIAGKVAITPKGVWDVATQYEKLDFVLYGDDSYVARKQSVGIEPGTDDETWMLSLRGASAQQIQDIINGTTTVGNADKLDGYDSEDFLKTTGGDVTGNVTFLSTGEEAVDFHIKNSLRDVLFKVRANGSFVIYDVTSDRPLFDSALDTGAIFHGTASGNVAISSGAIDVHATIGQSGFAFKKEGVVKQYFTYNHNTDVINRLDTNYVAYTMLDTKNKPTGTYTGNGGYEGRGISLGGIGQMLLITQGYWNTLVTNTGGFAWNVSSGATTAFSSSEIRYDTNTQKLLLYGTHEAINASGTTYNYQVL